MPQPADETRTLPGGTDADPAAPFPSTVSLPPADLPDVPGYKVLGPLGEGGMGAVYLALHLGLNRLVALKTAIAGGDRAAERFRAESTLVARVDHPHVLRVYDFLGHGGRWYLVTEHCPGGTLRDRLAGDTLMWTREAVTLARQVAGGVAAAHALGIVHRDIKPANVLIAADGTARVADFGLALLEAGTDDAPSAGTPAYRAPEQVEGRPPTRATDVWALGAVLYEMLTGRRPFDADTARGLDGQILTQDPPAPREVVRTVPRELSEIVTRCLEKDPARRYGSAAELERDLGRFLDGVPVTAGRSYAGRWAAWVGVVLLLGIGLQAGVELWYGGYLTASRDTAPDLSRAKVLSLPPPRPQASPVGGWPRGLAVEVAPLPREIELAPPPRVMGD